ncbi:hypothetical protein [Phormidesmis priestleyi]
MLLVNCAWEILSDGFFSPVGDAARTPAVGIAFTRKKQKCDRDRYSS